MGELDPRASEPERALLDALGVSRGHFRYESGHHGDLWLELEALWSEPRRARGWAAQLASRAAGCGAEIACGPLTGGAFLAQSIATEMGAGFAFAARCVAPPATVRYGIPAALRHTVRHRRVLLVDDAINAGSALRATWDELLDCGARVVGVACLATLGDAAARIAAEKQVPLFALAAIERRLWNAASCGLCVAGIALEDRHSGIDPTT